MSGRPKLNIDEAFETEEDDAVRSYGSTTESTPLKPKRGMSSEENTVVVRVEDPKDRGKFSRLKLPDDTLSKDSDSLIQCDPYCRKYDAKDG